MPNIALVRRARSPHEVKNKIILSLMEKYKKGQRDIYYIKIYIVLSIFNIYFIIYIFFSFKFAHSALIYIFLSHVCETAL